jgi:quercetin dioxygenase-like cupin family protein
MSSEPQYAPALPEGVRILADDDSCPELEIIEGGGRARAIAWPGVGSHQRSMHRISLSASGVTHQLQHPMESVYYVISGEVTASDLDEGVDHMLVKGSMILIDPGTRYTLSGRGDGAEIVGGPCPPDPGLYLHLAQEA